MRYNVLVLANDSFGPDGVMVFEASDDAGADYAAMYDYATSHGYSEEGGDFWTFVNKSLKNRDVLSDRSKPGQYA